MKRFALAILFASAAITQAAAYTEEAHKDWPCVQRLVPELSAGMMWSGPPVTDETADWRADEATSTLVGKIALRRVSEEDAAALIGAYADGLPAQEKAAKLTAVFNGFLENANRERKDIIAGIERFTRKQRQLVEGIRERRDELKALLAIENPTEADDKRRREIEEALNWQTRIHEDREKSLTYVCDIPVLLDQRVFNIAREIANRIE